MNAVLSTTLAFAILCAGAAVRTSRADVAADEMKKLQGTWIITGESRDGQDRPMTRPSDSLTVVIAGDEMKFYELLSNGKTELNVTYKIQIDAGSTPPSIDLIQEKHSLAGVYKLEGDQWLLCISTSRSAGDRPKEVAPGKKTQLMTMKRVADAAPAPKRARNPQYSYWVKFKPGSSVTMSGAMDSDGKKIIMQMKATLLDVAAEGVTIEKVLSVNVDGKETVQPPHNEVVLALATGDSPKEIGDDEITITGKLLKCKLYETQTPVGEGKTTPTMVWVSDMVPGGAVKMIVKNPQGSVTFTVKAYDAK